MVEYGGDMASHEDYRKRIEFWGRITIGTIILANFGLFWVCYCYLGNLLLLANLLTGVCLLEWAWHVTQRIHNVDEERDALFPAFRRLEAKHWNKWLHYPIAVTLALPKLWFLFIMLPGAAVLGKIILFGYKQRPIVGWRKTWADIQYFCCGWFFHMTLNVKVERIRADDFDYSEWLGPGYKEKQELPAKVSTHIAAPHASWLDTVVMQYFENHAFAVKKEAEKNVIVRNFLAPMQVFYIDRKAGDQAVNEIIEKQEAVEKDPRNPPIMVMPEGTQSNGKYLLPFKRGAFEGLKTVQPIVTVCEKSPKYMRPSWECLGFLEQIFLTGTICSFYTLKMTRLPPFKPNDYLFEKYADKGTSKAEIFAWAARDLMSKVSKCEKIEVHARDKALYKDFITGKTDEMEYKGKKFAAPPIASVIPCAKKKKRAKSQ